jgi:hypothetical protein
MAAGIWSILNSWNLGWGRRMMLMTKFLRFNEITTAAPLMDGHKFLK